MKPYYENENGKLYHGDCLEIMLKLGKVDLVLTDPPYGTTACSWDEIIDIGEMWQAIGAVVSDRTPIVLCSSQPFTSKLIVSNINNFRYEWIWGKNKASNFIRCNNEPLKKHENILVFSKKACNYYPIKTKVLRTIKSVTGNNSQEYQTGNHKSVAKSKPRNYILPVSYIEHKLENKPVHPTQKPVSLMKHMILTYSKQGETVLDFTCGSGSTLVAAEELGRKWIGIEKKKIYCEIAKQRISTENKQLKLFK